jgi:alkanesulfonate monooxygenase SsuD/methylene tetrahydromethanopterin reductase-like flavin-dependent oxidoreductase (luciferase family)
MLERLDEACADANRDIASLGRSMGVFVEPGTEGAAEAAGLGVPISGSTDQIADTLSRFGQLGVDRVEIMPWPQDEKTLAAIEPAIHQLKR